MGVLYLTVALPSATAWSAAALGVSLPRYISLKIWLSLVSKPVKPVVTGSGKVEPAASCSKGVTSIFLAYQ
jgi:hypothetical protein